jgi:hypothetical protein
MKERPDKKHERKRSHTVDLRKMDTTMMSEIEYINIFPDMEKLDQEMDDSSFLKNSFVDKSGPHVKMNHKRIESMDVSKIEENKMQTNGGDTLVY